MRPSTAAGAGGISGGMERSQASVDAFADEDERIYRREVSGLVRFATTLVGADDAADVVSDAVLAAFTSPGWRSVRQPRAYLYRAVLNQARMQQRASGRRRRREQAAAPREGFDHPLPRPDVVRAIAALSLRQRAVVYLVYWEGLSHHEAARRLGVSPGAVKRHDHRARRTLREVLDE